MMAYGDLPRKKRRCLSQASVMDKGTGLPSASPAPLFCPPDTSHQSLKFLCGNILITGSTALMGVRLFGYSLLVPAVLVCVF